MPIDQVQFDRLIKEMLVVFYHPGEEVVVNKKNSKGEILKNKDGSPQKEKIRSNEYFEILYSAMKDKVNTYMFKEVTKRLTFRAETKRFPLPAEFIKTAKEVREDEHRALIAPSLLDLGDDFYCKACANIGIKTVMKFSTFYNEERPVAVPCTCAEGKKIADGWSRNDEERNKRRKKKW